MHIAQLTTSHNRNSNGRHSPFALRSRALRPPNDTERRRAVPPKKRRCLRLGHVHLKVRDLNRSVPFYTRMLGLRLTEWVKRYAFLAIGSEHHSIALEEIGDWAINPPRRAVGVAHIAFQVPDCAAFDAMLTKLRQGKSALHQRQQWDKLGDHVQRS